MNGLVDYGSDISSDNDIDNRKIEHSEKVRDKSKKKVFVVDLKKQDDSSDSEDEQELRSAKKPKEADLSKPSFSIASVLPKPKLSVNLSQTERTTILLVPRTIDKSKLTTIQVQPSRNVGEVTGEYPVTEPYPVYEQYDEPPVMNTTSTTPISSESIDADTLAKLGGRRDGNVKVIQSVNQQEQLDMSWNQKAQAAEMKAKEKTRVVGGFDHTDKQQKKHNIQWLMHRARANQEKLEERFAELKRKRSEAGKRYGY